jgi:hypothetical protein
LGCPKYRDPVGGFFAEQSFERGRMYWSEKLDWMIAIIGDRRSRTWYLSTEKWDHAKADCVPRITPEPGSKPLQPVRGFGSWWCSEVRLQKAIGFAVEDEHGVYEDLLQEFERGFVLLGGDGSAYILFGDGVDGTDVWEKGKVK